MNEYRIQRNGENFGIISRDKVLGGKWSWVTGTLTMALSNAESHLLRLRGEEDKIERLNAGLGDNSAVAALKAKIAELEKELASNRKILNE